ncbi:hypothetical protein ECG_02747 [Echinococcus granulosus]|nr:hypothetical protein ECG_02747 [Echinococcus granulosus]
METSKHGGTNQPAHLEPVGLCNTYHPYFSSNAEKFNFIMKNVNKSRDAIPTDLRCLGQFNQTKKKHNFLIPHTLKFDKQGKSHVGILETCSI